ncbi:hypothetical protein EUGRSUZ_A02585 [Eucalyptus grandis]|uniref:Uncharacterized protein n=2 Tax=Eucalyptus grandis TaxID=71139 RepID=A0ACC3M7M8_EUCGR|nr:hypothetical protein EUGRSUZ_A02585 [Eucalyptus grandis]
MRRSSSRTLHFPASPSPSSPLDLPWRIPNLLFSAPNPDIPRLRPAFSDSIPPPAPRGWLARAKEDHEPRPSRRERGKRSWGFLAALIRVFCGRNPTLLRFMLLRISGACRRFYRWFSRALLRERLLMAVLVAPDCGLNECLGVSKWRMFLWWA